MAKDSKDPPHGEQHKGVTPPASTAQTPGRIDAHELPQHVRQAQAQAAEPPPKAVKLEPAKDELGQPADAPPTAPKAKDGPVPRIIDQSERSPDPQRLSRFVVRCDQPFGAQPKRYVLAPKGDKQAAINHYLEKTGIKAIMDTYPSGQAPIPMMVARELPD